MYSSYSLCISYFSVKGQILPFEFKTVPRSTKREKNARKTSCRHASLTSKRYVCCNTSTYASNSQVLYTLGGWGWKSVCNKNWIVNFYGSTFSIWMKRAKPPQDTLQASPPLNSSLVAIIIMKEMPVPTPRAHNRCKGGGAGGIFFLVQHQWREK